MKSRNLKAIFASGFTVAFLATAMTSFAADATVTTTTTYNTGNDKIAVTTNVTGATTGSEVTYLVKSGDTIVYIDQDTAVNGAVGFDYKIAKEKMNGYSSAVKFGTDAGDVFAGTGATDLGIGEITAPSGDHYTVTYNASVAGVNEAITANIAVDEGYEIVDVKVDGVSKGAVSSVEIIKGQTITVETKEAKKAAAIQVYKEFDTTAKTFTAVIIPTGDITEFGIEYALFENIPKQYPSVEPDTTKTAAVRLILPEDSTATETEFKPYFVADGETSYEYTDYTAAE